jgi:hypothetical protein
MAQEVEQVLPHAVIEINGYKVVNYGALQWTLLIQSCRTHLLNSKCKSK